MYSFYILATLHRADSVETAAAIWRVERDKLDLGASQQCGIAILRDGARVARVTYNGKIER